MEPIGNRRFTPNGTRDDDRDSRISYGFSGELSSPQLNRAGVVFVSEKNPERESQISYAPFDLSVRAYRPQYRFLSRGGLSPTQKSSRPRLSIVT